MTITAPTVSFTPTGTDPKIYSQSMVETEINDALAALTTAANADIAASLQPGDSVEGLIDGATKKLMTATERANLASVVSLTAGLQISWQPDALFTFADSDDRIVGQVLPTGAWDIALQDLRTAGGLRVIDYAVNGDDTDEIVIVDSAMRIIWSSGPPARTGPESAPTPLVNEAALRLTRMRLTQRLLGEAGQLNIVLIGDSFTQNRLRYTGPMATYLATTYGDGGGGWTGYGFFGGGSGPWAIGGTQPTGPNQNVRAVTYVLRYGGTWTANYGGSDGPDLCHVTSAVAGSLIERTVPATPDHTALRVVFIGTADGVVRHRVDGGAWTNVNVQGTVGDVQSFDIALTPGAHTIQIEVVSGTVTLCGDNALSSASGVRVHKAAASGSRVGQWTARNAARQAAGWAMLAPDLFIIMDGTNSQGAAVAPDVWGADMARMVDRFRRGAATPDIMIALPPENNRDANAVPMWRYAPPARALAAAADVAFLDMQPYFGRAPDDYRATGPRPLFNADLVHPEPDTGGRLLLAAILAALRPF